MQSDRKFIDEASAENSVVTYPIEKRLRTDLFIDGAFALLSDSE